MSSGETIWGKVTRSKNIQKPGTARSLLRWAVMMVLVNIGWLFFREQNLHELGRQLAANPFDANAADWRIGGFFAALMAIYSLPLWLHAWLEKPLLSKWSERSETWGSFMLQTAGGIVLMFLFLSLASRETSDFIYFQF